jgi:hypothetical protein
MSLTLPGDAMLCGLCGSDEAHNFHHLIPCTLRSNKWFKKRFTREEMQRGLDLCRDCHSAVHDLIPDEKVLGRHHHTVETLLAHPEVAKYVAWKRKKARAPH